MAVDSDPRRWRVGIKFQQQREKNGLTQEGVFLQWQDRLISMGYQRKWPTVGGRWIGRIERGEAVRDLSNIELHALCDVLRFTPEERAEVFALLGLDATIISTEASEDTAAKQISIYVHGRLYKIIEEMTNIVRHTITNGPVNLTPKDLEEIYEDATEIIKRRHR